MAPRCSQSQARRKGGMYTDLSLERFGLSGLGKSLCVQQKKKTLSRFTDILTASASSCSASSWLSAARR